MLVIGFTYPRTTILLYSIDYRSIYNGAYTFVVLIYQGVSEGLLGKDLVHVQLPWARYYGAMGRLNASRAFYNL